MLQVTGKKRVRRSEDSHHDDSQGAFGQKEFQPPHNKAKTRTSRDEHICREASTVRYVQERVGRSDDSHDDGFFDLRVVHQSLAVGNTGIDRFACGLNCSTYGESARRRIHIST